MKGFRLVTVGRSNCKWAEQATGDYAKRLRRYGGIQEETVKHETFRGDVAAVKRAEGQRILKRLAPRDCVVALDERGLSLSSHEFAELMEQGRQRGQVVFCIGGAYGLDPGVRERAWKTITLSPMVLNHEVARVVLYEQVYRAMTILSGVPYHH